MSNRQLCSIAILVLCGMAAYVIPAQTEDGEDAAFAGASLLPNLAIALIFLFTALDLAVSFLRQRTPLASGETDVPMGVNQVRGVCAVALLLFIFTLILSPAGYLLSSALLLGGLMLVTGGRDRLQILVTSVVAAGVLFAGLRFAFGININALPAMLS